MNEITETTETKIYACDAHIKEHMHSRPDHRLFECWLEGAANIFPCLEYQACV